MNLTDSVTIRGNLWEEWHSLRHLFRLQDIDTRRAHQRP